MAMTKIIPIEKGSSLMQAVITCCSKDAPFEHDHKWWKITDARERSDNFVDIVLSDVY